MNDRRRATFEESYDIIAGAYGTPDGVRYARQRLPAAGRLSAWCCASSRRGPALRRAATAAAVLDLADRQPRRPSWSPA
ncbi:MAG: hypothetical protein HS111_23715 [Kofleriaceae bacterium]|nr:hypothetical protein [Kofleriaceae bacterium]